VPPPCRTIGKQETVLSTHFFLRASPSSSTAATSLSSSSRPSPYSTAHQRHKPSDCTVTMFVSSRGTFLSFKFEPCCQFQSALSSLIHAISPVSPPPYAATPSHMVLSSPLLPRRPFRARTSTTPTSSLFLSFSSFPRFASFPGTRRGFVSSGRETTPLTHAHRPHLGPRVTLPPERRFIITKRARMYRVPGTKCKGYEDDGSKPKATSACIACARWRGSTPSRLAFSSISATCETSSPVSPFKMLPRNFRNSVTTLSG
jgi:hypothetical protein